MSGAGKTDMPSWYDLSRQQQAKLIAGIAFNLSFGDDDNIHLSNLSREVLAQHGICESTLWEALETISTRWCKA